MTRSRAADPPPAARVRETARGWAATSGGWMDSRQSTVGRRKQRALTGCSRMRGPPRSRWPERATRWPIGHRTPYVAPRRPFVAVEIGPSAANCTRFVAHGIRHPKFARAAADLRHTAEADDHG